MVIHKEPTYKLAISRLLLGIKVSSAKEKEFLSIISLCYAKQNGTLNFSQVTSSGTSGSENKSQWPQSIFKEFINELWLIED